MKRLEWANALRGVAALSVLAVHYCVVFWVSQDVAAGLARRPPLYAGDAGAPGFARALHAIPFDLAAFGVALFFLISGYVIAISLDRYSRRGFLVGRAMRVLPTYAAGYLVTCAFVWAVSDPAGELSVGSVLAGMVPGLPLLLGISAPGDGIVWTLIVELVFYAVCLAGYRALTRRAWVIAAVASVCVILQLLVPAPTVLAGSSVGGLTYIVLLACPFVPVMLVGVVLSAHHRGHLGGVTALVAVPTLTAVHGILLATSRVVPVSAEYRWTFIGSVAVFCVVSLRGQRWRPHPVANFFADISYPLYVVHPVLGYVMLSLLTAGGLRSPAAVLVTTVTAVGAAWLIHRVVERPTHHWGRQWARTLGGAGDAGADGSAPPHASAEAVASLAGGSVQSRGDGEARAGAPA